MTTTILDCEINEDLLYGCQDSKAYSGEYYLLDYNNMYRATDDELLEPVINEDGYYINQYEYFLIDTDNIYRVEAENNKYQCLHSSGYVIYHDYAPVVCLNNSTSLEVIEENSGLYLLVLSSDSPFLYEGSIYRSIEIFHKIKFYLKELLMVSV